MSNQILLKKNPIAESFTLAVLKVVKKKIRPEKHNIDADIIPKLSKKIPIDPFKHKRNMIESSRKNTLNQLNKLAQPINKPLRNTNLRKPTQSFERDNSQLFYTRPTEDWGQLNGVLSDPTVSVIDCPGPDKNFTVIRSGQKQITKIKMSSNEMREFLEKVATIARVPLLEGVFRAAVDNFYLNAVISEVIDNRFIIKKQIPYHMLENKDNKN